MTVAARLFSRIFDFRKATSARVTNTACTAGCKAQNEPLSRWRMHTSEARLLAATESHGCKNWASPVDASRCSVVLFSAVSPFICFL